MNKHKQKPNKRMLGDSHCKKMCKKLDIPEPKYKFKDIPLKGDE